jgi:class 3 adenylate cyclase
MSDDRRRTAPVSTVNARPVSQPFDSTDPSGAGGSDELRPVTALFADIVGSTGLGERMSPDEVKALVGECVTRMSRVVEEFGGTVQAYMGDGVCAYFGVPTAHEDDADRAAEAGLAVLQMVGSYGRDVRQAWDIEEFNVRIGINGGLAAVGMVGAGQPQAVALGDMTNVAARLQSAAAPGTIVTGEETAQRLMPRFVLEPMGELALKGRAAPVSAWRVLRRKTTGRDHTQSPLVGREAEAARLRAAADDLLAGRGQSLLLIGDAGLGKSRLLGELRENLGPDVTWLEGDCRSYGAVGLYQPFVEMIRAWLGIDHTEREIVVRTRLRARLPALYDGEADDALMYIGHLLSVQPEPDHRDLLREGDTEDLAAGTRAAFCDWTLRLSRRAPVVVAIEGLHEADVATCEMLEDLLELTDRAPVMVAMSSRPEQDTPAWRFRAHAMTNFAHRFEELALEPISAEAARQLLDITAPGLLDPSTREELVARAEGNPLYLEEMAYALEADEIRPRAWTVTVGSAPALPASLDGLLIARMDRLDPEARALGQTAAVIGREFPARVLERVAGAERFEAGLPGLLRSGVVREVRRYPELEYSFRHGLLQEAARSTLTQARRAALCARVAEVFEELFADTLDERMEMLAHYHAQSGNLSKALEYLDRSAERADGWGQRDEAVRLWRRALRVAERMDDPQVVERLRHQLGDSADVAEPAAGRDRAQFGERPAATRTRIGPYTLEGAAQTAGAVVRGLTADGDPVAVRLVGRSDGGEDGWERLRAAAAQAARVDDRGLVPGVRADEADGWRYVVLAWCDGGSLADRLAGGRGPSAEETVRIVVRVARALDALHSAGIVHGGVRSTSILFDGDGRALLVPIATGPEGSGAPEVQAGADATPLSDIYDLAAIAQACLARTEHVSDDLDWAIGTALAADPSQRPQSAAMFGQMLRTAGRATTTG